MWPFQLTRSVGSVTDTPEGALMESVLISTHTLRGERDQAIQFLTKIMWPFQLTRSVGSVTPPIAKLSAFPVISTHTLRGERDHAEI